MRSTAHGLFGLVAAILGAAFCITLVTGSLAHWPIVVAGIIVGLRAANIITKS